MAKKINVNYKVIIAAIAALVVLEALALFKGINGTLFSLVIMLIAGLAGYVIPSPIKLR